MQHILGMQEGSLLPKYVKRICRFRFLFNFALDKAGTETEKRIKLGFIFSVVAPTMLPAGSIVRALYHKL